MSATVIPLPAPVPTFTEVLQARACVPACLLSPPTDYMCQCRCGGLYHGILYDILAKRDVNNQKTAKP